MEDHRTMVLSKEILQDAITKSIMESRGKEAQDLVGLARMCGMEVFFK